MKPTEILSNEHRIIEQVLGCLEAIAHDAESAGRLDPQAASDAIAFLRNFADRCHHGKEETHLFPALEAKGFPRDGGPTGVMLHEHEQGRAHIRGMDENVAAAAAGDPAALGQFIDHAKGYVSLLREHIYKEDNILFRLADRALGESDQQALLAAFSRVEAEEMDQGTHEKFLKIARELAARYGVAAALTSPPGGQFHCGHTH
jgi:hemerythrin-like domain-containing protein